MANCRRWVNGLLRHFTVLLFCVCMARSQSGPYDLAAAAGQCQTMMAKATIECTQTKGRAIIDAFEKLSTAGIKDLSLTLRDLFLSNNVISHLFTEQNAVFWVKVEMTNVTLNSTDSLDGLAQMTHLVTLTMNNMSISRIKPNPFTGMQNLTTLGLNDDGIETIEPQALGTLVQLQQLSLRNNRLTEFPVAVNTVPDLQELDLLGNDIVTVTNNTADEVTGMLSQLKILRMNRLNCTCNLGKGKFVQWVQKQGLTDVMCNSPDKLKSQYVVNIDKKGFCGSGTALAAALSLVIAATVAALLH